MKLTKIIACQLILAILVSASCQSTKESNKNLVEYKPKYQEKWHEVNNFVLNNWDKFSNKIDALPYPFTYALGPHVLFYWDMYFTNVGLLKQERLDLALGNANNFIYEIEKYGFIPNASESWGTNRSQPAYFSMMARDIYEVSGDKEWLQKAYVALKTEYSFWMDTTASKIEDHSTGLYPLIRFGHHASKADLVTLYDHIAERFGMDLEINEEEKAAIGSPFTAEAASGMDFTPRFESRCPDFVAVDLNSNLYVYEKNFAWMVEELGLHGETDWEKHAAARKEAINKYCWNEERGLYLDYDFVNKRHSSVAAATSFSPLFAGLASPEQAKRMVDNLSLFETDFGIRVCEPSETKYTFQWDHNAIWPPMQLLVVKGLNNYGYNEDAKRIATKYMDLLTKHFVDPQPSEIVQKDDTTKREPGYIYEKYKVDGLINDNEYTASVMMGWTGGVFAYAYDLVAEKNEEKIANK